MSIGYQRHDELSRSLRAMVAHDLAYRFAEPVIAIGDYAFDIPVTSLWANTLPLFVSI